MVYIMSNTTTIDTRAGRKIDLANPAESTIEIGDIACALSRICRFAGHSNTFYSVAQHAILVADIVDRLGHPRLKAWALHHDSHEAYIGDLSSPLKRLLVERREYSTLKRTANDLDVAIRTAFRIHAPTSGDAKVVKYADLVALAAESRALMPEPLAIPPLIQMEPLLAEIRIGEALTPAASEEAFLAAHRLVGEQS